MLETIRIENFRCLKSVEVPLRPLTVLIGPNDSGKSAFLAALNYLVNGPNVGRWTDHWRSDPQVPVSIVGFTQTGTVKVTDRAAPDNESVFETLRPLQLFHFPSQGAVMQWQGHNDEQGPPTFSGSGEGVPTLLDYLLRRNRKQFFAAVDAMRALIPGLEDVEIATPSPAERRLDLVIEHGLRIPADLASSGVRLLLVFVALAYHPSPPKTILLEEPETGVHPRRLADVLRLLREITEGKHGGPAQVILTTHSPYLLDLVDLNREKVVVFRRLEDGSRTAQAADPERLKRFLEEFMLGEVWFNQGEEGLVARSSS
jgi:predicted ATPase